MAINVKCVFIFGSDKWGWTETFYWSANSGTLSNAMDAATLLARKRIPLLGTGCTLEAIRVSDTANKTSTVLDASGNYGGIPAVQPVGSPWQSALCTMSGSQTPTVLYKRSLLLRGLPDLWYVFDYTRPTNPVINPLFKSVLNTFLKALITGGAGNPSPWAIRASDRNRTVNPTYQIVAVGTSPLPGQYFTITVPLAPVSWVTGYRIHVTGVRGPGTNGINADAWITGSVGTVYTLSTRQKCPSGSAVLEGNAVAYARQYIYATIQSAEFERFVKRDTGRPFFGTRGRRSTKSC